MTYFEQKLGTISHSWKILLVEEHPALLVAAGGRLVASWLRGAASVHASWASLSQEKRYCAFKCKQSHVNTYKGDDVFLLFMENRIALNYFFFLWTSLKVVISKRLFSFLTYMSTGTCVRDGNY